MQHFRSTSAQGLRTHNVHTRVMEKGDQLLIWDKYIVFFFYSAQLRSPKVYLRSSDTKGRPVVLLPRYNWNHCELSYVECSLPVCICLIGPSADAYKFMQYAKMKASFF